MAGIMIDKNDKKKNYRNQSLWATSLTRLDHARGEELVTKELSGHRSNAIHTYKVTPDATRCENCKIIQGQTGKSEPTATVSKPVENNDEVFEKNVKEIRTPLKTCNDIVDPTDSSSVCDFIQKM